MKKKKKIWKKSKNIWKKSKLNKFNVNNNKKNQIWKKAYFKT